MQRSRLQHLIEELTPSETQSDCLRYALGSSGKYSMFGDVSQVGFSMLLEKHSLNEVDHLLLIRECPWEPQ